MRTERRNAIRGTDIRTFPFFVKLHVELSRASSIFFSVSFALSRLLAKVSKTSWRLLGSDCEKLGASILSGTAAAVTLPGTDAMCRANWPREKDLGWGFQASLSSGIRSKTRFVVCASWSISIKMESTSLITAPFYCFFEQNLFTTKAANPPAEITLPASSTALPMQNGHIIFSRRRDDTHRVAVHRTRDSSARFRTPSWICFQPPATPFRWSSKISPTAV